MQVSACVNSVIELLDLIFPFEKTADGIVNTYLRSRRYIGSKDRRYITNSVWSVLRRYGRYSSLVSGVLDGRTAVLLHLHYCGENPAVVFSGEKYAPAPLTEEERVFLAGLPSSLPAETYECPDWLKNRIDTADLAAMCEEAPLDLRVNTLKISVDEALSLLKAEGLSAEKTPLSPVGIRIFGRPNILQSRFYQDGLVEIQDEGSQLISLLTGAKSGEKVLDWCAGAGGKTLALAAMMENKGTIYAADADIRRLKDLPVRALRADVRNVIVLNTYNSLRADFDLVLIDAPCSGTGTWRRAPDARWRTPENRTAGLVSIQSEILDNACAYVKPGGRLFYITCSVYGEENETQVERFLVRHPEFELEDLSSMYFGITGQNISGKMIHLKPSEQKTDGFFAVSLKCRNRE